MRLFSSSLFASLTPFKKPTIDKNHPTFVAQPSTLIYAGNSPIHGRGVFAAHAISAGTVVEQCPVITVKLQEMVARQHLLLNYYSFMIDESQELAGLALGYGSLYNHADDNNTSFYYDSTKNLMLFETLIPIAKHQELTINYLGPESKGQTIDYWAQKPDIASL